MNKTEKDFYLHRPEDFFGDGDKYLPALIGELEKYLKKIKEVKDSRIFNLKGNRLKELSGLVIEFAEDLHNDTGFWKSYENYNTGFFASPVPLLLRENEMIKDKFDKRRIQHFLWIIYAEMEPFLNVSPTIEELEILGEKISDFLKEKFKKIPQDSGVKKFLTQPDKYAWDIKRKLVWAGTRSYFFRKHCENYIMQEGGVVSIPLIDDFVCQATTSWSGLGVIDILSEMADITEEQRKDLRNWYERHMALYLILNVKESEIEARNIINDKVYNILNDQRENQFEINDLIFGSLVPWDGKWYWSGQQQTFSGFTKKQLEKVRKDFIQNTSIAVYRYHEELLLKARERAKKSSEDFVKYFGDDLVIFPDGLTMASKIEKKDRMAYENLPKKKLTAVMKKYKLKKPSPLYSYPHYILDSDNGIALYSNREEGQEMMMQFNDVISGFEKKGVDLFPFEKEAVRAFIKGDSISPGFVKRVIRDYGDLSIAASFYLDKSEDKYYTDYLLRKYKGHFYRKRYPWVTIME